MSELPLVSFAILAYDRRDELAVTLAALRDDLDYPADRLEVIVVDNASTDGTAEMVRRDFPAVRLIEEPENIGMPALNHAFSAARGDYVVALDDDSVITGDALRRAVEGAAGHHADLVSFFVSSPGEDRDFSAEWSTGLLSFWGCGVLISRRALDRLGGFDPNIFLWANELDLTMRLLDAGLTHLYLPDVEAIHRKLPAAGFNLRGFRLNIRHHAYVAVKLLRSRDAAMALANLGLTVLGETLNRREAAVGLRDLLAGARTGLAVRRPVRPAVSRMYRRDFIGFASPVRFVRGPVARWRARGVEGAGEAAVRRELQAFYAERPALYPREAAALRL